ncbi:MAG: DUF2007 domain-containing protein [Planctomycetaceae bacterium]|nr:DUF2007 domain-containing protein [Planctomycetaceae bacterium]
MSNAAIHGPGEEIVELCSAGNVTEADSICEVLADASIQAQVVGDILGTAGGGLPLGETIAPRVWVHKGDLVRAREIVERWREECESGERDLPETEPAATDEEPVEEDLKGPLPSDVRFRFLNQVFWIGGMVCIAIGAIWAWQNWAAISQHPGLADGKLEGAGYSYVVGGKTYYAGADSGRKMPSHAPVYYDPKRPVSHVVGPIAPPWLIFGIAMSIGLLLCFVGYQFRWPAGVPVPPEDSSGDARP